MTLIPENEARQRQLPGCDGFKRTQLAYKDDFHRDHFVVSLNREALKIFNLSVTFGQHSQLKKQQDELQKQLADGTFKIEEYQISELDWRLLEYVNLEFFYIATGFEIHFKAWLLQNNFIVNIIDNIEPFKDLKKEQKDRPIDKAEFFGLGSFQYDTNRQRNILQGLSDQSLSFNTVCNTQNYTNALNISADILGVVDDYRNLRNEIHLPGDFVETPNIERLAGTATGLMISFINQRVVENSNNIIGQRGFNFTPLSNL